MKYETLYLVHPRHEGPGLEEVVQAVGTVAVTAGAEVESHQALGKRRLAFAIKGSEEGQYVALTFRLPPKSPAREIIGRLEGDLRHREPILRFLTVRLED